MKQHSFRYNPATLPTLGILEWFHFEEYEHVEKAIDQLRKLGITHLRTGFSWADYHRPGGEAWFDWLIPKLGSSFNILPCFLYTPPSIGIVPKTSSPPKDPYMFGYFVGQMIDRYDEYLEYVELWNEPNNMSEYDFTLDQSWNIFVTMISDATKNAHQRGKKVLLGGMSPVDPNWMEHMRDCGVLEMVDAVGIHGFPNVFDSHWWGWDQEIERTAEILQSCKKPPELWITEVGYSTWQYNERQQLKEFLDVLQAPVERVYWYSLNDLGEHYPTVDGFHLDEREYYFGLYQKNGSQKLLARLLEEKGISNIFDDAWMAQPYTSAKSIKIDDQKTVLITGGAGFIGTNLADKLLSMGHRVVVLDNLSRDGVIKNVRWLKNKKPNNLDIQIGDIRNPHLVKEVVQSVDMIFHFAAQVAVTTSLEDPRTDFDINVQGTLNILNAIRETNPDAPIIFTSTNKVYGGLDNLELQQEEIRYEPSDEQLRKNGLNESLSLDFHSPYGCSKGAADQYIIDHSRTLGIKSAVFRMSCIYGPHQCGNEDQGWVAHFAINAIQQKELTIYGDGKQVRDILYVEDLVDAFIAAWKNIDTISGRAFNIGGSPANSVSLLQVIGILESITGNKIITNTGDWRKGDQKYYVSDISSFKNATQWEPEVDCKKGINLLVQWLLKNVDAKKKQKHENIVQIPMAN